MTDPYANAFNKDGDYACYRQDKTEMGPYIWERKYEVDSLAFPLFLLEEYYKRKKDAVVTDRVKEAIRTVIRVW